MPRHARQHLEHPLWRACKRAGLRQIGWHVFSPLVVVTTPEHAELKAIARGCVTRYHNHHYLGFAQTQWDLFVKESPRRVKPLLYVYRVFLAGIHLMRTGEIEANIVRPNEDAGLPQIPELVARKLAGPEKATLDDADVAFHESEVSRLRRASKRRVPQAPWRKNRPLGTRFTISCCASVWGDTASDSLRRGPGR
jgi:predicted nucleotidyltransferase